MYAVVIVHVFYTYSLNFPKRNFIRHRTIRKELYVADRVHLNYNGASLVARHFACRLAQIPRSFFD